MPRRCGWMFCGFGAIGIALAAAWFASPRLPTVRFSGGIESRVLKVSYGTNHIFILEPFWKQTLRKVLPQAMEKPLGPEKRYARSTPYDSLTICLEPNLPRDLMIQAVFPDGTGCQPLRAHPLMVFTSYPRGEKDVVLRFLERQKSFDIKVPNPRPTRRASWSASNSVQTNRVQGTEIVFRPNEFWDEWRHAVSLRARSEISDGVGWTRWRTTLFDPCGNWYTGDYNKHPDVPGSQRETQFKLLAEGQEYISAGFVTTPINDQHSALTLHPRATNWGVQFLALLGPGAYEVSRQGAIQARKPNSLNSSFVTWNRSSCTVQCTQPALLSIASQPVWELRLRERLLPDRRGRVFAGRNVSSATLHPSVNEMFVAQLFLPRLPTITTNLEAELVIQWPPVEFFIEKPEKP